jgi:hypothetical protein
MAAVIFSQSPSQESKKNPLDVWQKCGEKMNKKCLGSKPNNEVSKPVERLTLLTRSMNAPKIAQAAMREG